MCPRILIAAALLTALAACEPNREPLGRDFPTVVTGTPRPTAEPTTPKDEGPVVVTPRDEADLPMAPSPGDDGQEVAGVDTAMSDAQIADISTAGHQHEVELATLVMAKTTSEDVRHFAQMMITDHTAAITKSTELLGTLGLTAENHPISDQMRTDGAARVAKLEALSGAELDRTYTAIAIQLHEDTLDRLDLTLIPNADSSELIALLTSARPVVAKHLEHARMLDQNLRGGV